MCRVCGVAGRSAHRNQKRLCQERAKGHSNGKECVERQGGRTLPFDALPQADDVDVFYLLQETISIELDNHLREKKERKKERERKRRKERKGKNLENKDSWSFDTPALYTPPVSPSPPSAQINPYTLPVTGAMHIDTQHTTDVTANVSSWLTREKIKPTRTPPATFPKHLTVLSPGQSPQVGVQQDF